MNEYLDAASPARLTGTFGDPEGLLTASIRRQPFSVVLLDEIEKAHLGVFDLLLQVLGEGRLTDALGRTADFGNAIIIMSVQPGPRRGTGARFRIARRQLSRTAAFMSPPPSDFSGRSSSTGSTAWCRSSA